jgi:hypothetical protein
MIATTHPVTPEDLMALLDGELPPEEARSVSVHLDRCAECANLVQQFRVVSQSLSSWTVPAAPPSLEETVLTQSAQLGASAKSPRTPRQGLLNWQLLAIGGGAAVAAVLVLVAVRASLISNEPRAAIEMKAQQATTSNRALYDEMDTRRVPAARQQEFQAVKSEPRQSDSLASMAPRAAAGASNRPVNGGSAIRASASQALPATTPLIARTVSLFIVVRDFPAARATLDAILVRHQGYSAQLTVNTQEGSPRGLQDSLRIPAPQLAPALAELKSLGRVQTETQSGEEVTQQHADLVARLQNSRESEQRLRDILAQRTGKIDDVLQVEEEIARVRGEIESTQAHQQALEHRVDFATVDLRLVEEFKEQFNSPTPSASAQIRNAFIAGMRSAAATLLGIVLFIEQAGPVILIWLSILVVPAALLWRRYRRLLSIV